MSRQRCVLHVCVRVRTAPLRRGIPDGSRYCVANRVVGIRQVLSSREGVFATCEDSV
jgi:hypothetical protein